jgi:anaerobic dimethyl sulfoxide reductase subunit A
MPERRKGFIFNSTLFLLKTPSSPTASAKNLKDRRQLKKYNYRGQRINKLDKPRQAYRDIIYHILKNSFIGLDYYRLHMCIKMDDRKAERIERIKTLLMQRHVEENYDYTGCYTNCGGSCCVMKVRIRDGKITVIEPDDHYNVMVGREDAVTSDADLMKNRLQQRACEVAWVWHKQLALPERVLYPLKRVDGARRGEGRFERISWDEALTIVAEKMKEAKEKYGPYSIITPYFDNPHLDVSFSFLGAGVQGWGWCSWDAERLVQHLMLGYPGWTPVETFDMADMLFNSKLIVLWGADPSNTRYGPAHQTAYYIKMARKRGTPVICIDPRYTDTAAVLADQWIPIKPGTDLAMMIAVAYVLFKEDLYDKEFVEKFVEPKGFKAWHDYVMGIEDGVPKTPNWAEEICGVPAETIEGFARLYARSKPTFLFKCWSVARKSYGENVARAAVILQSMTGNIGGPGGYNTLAPFARIRYYLDCFIPGKLPVGLRGKYIAPRMYRSNKWAEAVLLLDDVKEGKLSTEEYRKFIGWRADPNLPNPNPKVLLWGGYSMGTNFLVTGANATERQIKAILKMELFVQIASFMTPTAKYADIILPVADQTFEDCMFQHDSYGGFSNITLCPKIKDPSGEAKPLMWIYTKLAEKLGFGHLFNAYYREGEDWFAGGSVICRNATKRAVMNLKSKDSKFLSSRRLKRVVSLISMSCLINHSVVYVTISKKVCPSQPNRAR